MIFEAIFQFFSGIVYGLLDTLVPAVSYTLPENIFSSISDLFNLAGWFIPMKNLLVLVSIGYSLDIAQIVWALILRIKSFIPFLGN